MILKVITMTSSDRDALRFELDSLPDVFVHGNDIGFTKAFRTLTSEETFCAVPKCVIEKAREFETCLEGGKMTGFTRIFAIHNFDDAERELIGEGVFLEGKLHGLQRSKYPNGDQFGVTFYNRGKEASLKGNGVLDATKWNALFPNSRGGVSLTQTCCQLSDRLTLAVSAGIETLIVGTGIVRILVIQATALNMVKNLAFLYMERLEEVIVEGGSAMAENAGILSFYQCPKLRRICIKRSSFVNYRGFVLYGRRGRFISREICRCCGRWKSGRNGGFRWRARKTVFPR